MMIEATIIGASGYSGSELVKLLTGHPGARVKTITSSTFAGQPLTGLYPNLIGLTDLVFSELNITEAAASDVVFLAVPHGEAMKIAPKLRAAGAAKIIDLSGDFRLPAAVYEQWYGKEHLAPSLIEEAAYGLTELNKDTIAASTLVANPGCFATGVALAAAPFFAAGVIERTITATSLTGVSGAGRALSNATHFCSADENATAYKTGGVHQHIPEIEQALNELAAPAAPGPEGRVSFTPILAPLARGIYSTVTATLQTKLQADELFALAGNYYNDSRFVHLLAPGTNPQLKAVNGSNNCHIGLSVDERTNRLTILSAIDNLGKGAAGQAVQNMNIMFGLEEAAGLNVPGLYP